MKILVIGKDGQLGQSPGFIAKRSNNILITGTDRHDLDLSKTERIKDQTLRIIEFHKPDLVINAAAYTKVDQAEDEVELATLINAKSLNGLGMACRLSQTPFIHISTDYVFDGSSLIDYIETDKTNPLSVYGQSKRDGELILLDSNPSAIILRTSWVFSPFGNNFAKTMLKLAQTREHVSVVNDQWGAPTPAIEIAKTLIAMANLILHEGGTDKFGIYHAVSPDFTNWYEVAAFIFDDLCERTGQRLILSPIPTTSYPTKAHRPKRSVLSANKLHKDWGLKLNDWRQSLKADLDLTHGHRP